MNYTQLTEVERYQIEAYLKAGLTQTQIAHALGRSDSTISRELRRNRGQRGYRPGQAQRFAEARQQHHSHTRIEPATWRRVEQLLREDWSPEQISLWLTANGRQPVSTEWIYQYILTDKSTGGDLHTHLRCQKVRKKRYGRPDQRGQIANRVSIDERPACVERRQRIGDWELDTVIGRPGGTVLVTALERKSRLSRIALAPNKTAEAVKAAILTILTPIASSVKTLTYDNGKEFALHEQIAEQLHAKGYFAHPYHSWERGSNENTNGLIRQYLPKGTSFDDLTQEDMHFIMHRLNNRPRKCLDMNTPNQVFWGLDPLFALAS